MKNRDLQAIIVKNRVKNAVFVPIEKGDYDSERQYSRQGAIVRNFTVHNVYGTFAITGAETPEKAKALNDFYWYDRKRELRALIKILEHELSLNKMTEDGFDVPDTNAEPEAIVIEKMTVEQLKREIRKLPDESRHICSMVGEGVTLRDMAREMKYCKSTMQDKKTRIMQDLKKKIEE